MPRQWKAEQQERLRKEYWPEEKDIWTGKDEKGWFPVPRTLPVILAVLDSKKISGNKKPSLVYAELLSRHWNSGIVEIEHEAEHALAVGYSSTRGPRSWKERMKILEDVGFIKSVRGGARQYKYVLLVHPDVAFRSLHTKGKVSKDLWEAYRDIQIKSGAEPYRERKDRVLVEVVPIKKGTQRKKKRAKA